MKSRITIREEHAAPALEVMTRFGADPRWLIHLPPTMSPPETSSLDGFLEHPAEAFDYYRRRGVETVVCQAKHMGSRAIAVVCRNESVAADRFGISDQGTGIVYTRTGRPFFNKPEMMAEFITSLREQLDAANAWEQLESDWVCLDCELMPWSAKAHDLIKSLFAPVGAAGELATKAAVQQMELAVANGVEGLGDELAIVKDRLESLGAYRKAYRQYCWKTEGLQGLKLAPFHILATEGSCHFDKPHSWHMDQIRQLVENAGGDLLTETANCTVNLADEDSAEAATQWWLEMTNAGGEGMVVKPLDFIHRHKGEVLQPAIKCRGREYLRIIYGPEYLRPENLKRLRNRGLSHKRSMAIREFALGHESLERFVKREPLRRIHECVLAVLAMESEPVDPRL